MRRNDIVDEMGCLSSIVKLSSDDLMDNRLESLEE